jgi:biopolymer transport protein ExbD
MRRAVHSTGLEGAPDIMLLTMAALMVAIVWLVSHAHERTLPPVELPEAAEARLGTGTASTATVTLRPLPEGDVEVYLEDARVPGDLDGLEEALRAALPTELVLRADARTAWQQALLTMNVAAKLRIPLSVAGDLP